MNVAHFASAFYPSHGGVQEFVRQLARQQRKDGERPLVVTNRWPKSLPAAELCEEIPVCRYVFRVPDSNWRQLLGAALFEKPTLAQIVDALRERKAEIVHIQCVSSNAYYALQASKRLNLPLVVTVHGELSVDENRLFQRSRFAQNLLRQVLREADAITACSEHTLREAEAFYGKPFGERGRAIHNGVQADEFAGAKPYPHPRPYVLAIGRQVQQKGFDILLHAWAKIVSQTLSTHDLLIAGDGNGKKSLQRLAATLGLCERVRFIGATDRATTARLFVGCSFFALPSRQEPLGIVNLEAMAAGKAVLATHVGGVPEIVQDERTGLLVEPENVKALATGLCRLITDRDLCERLGKAGQERAKKFDWQSVAQDYRKIYSSLRR